MDGKGNPTIREFSNVSLSEEPQDESVLPFFSQEQLVDIIDEPRQVRILAELPGVDKSIIRTTVVKDSMIIRVISRSRKFRKRLQLPTGVDPGTLKTRYNNGCLEITLRKLMTPHRTLPK
jgi:HSP20 family protein